MIIFGFGISWDSFPPPLFYLFNYLLSIENKNTLDSFTLSRFEIPKFDGPQPFSFLNQLNSLANKYVTLLVN